MALTPEGKIVAYAKKRLKEKGCLVRKIAYEMRRGCPDMLVLVPEYYWEDNDGGYGLPSRVIFIEYKATEDTPPEEHQLREHERMRAVGADVRVVGSKRQVDALIGELFPNE